MEISVKTKIDELVKALDKIPADIDREMTYAVTQLANGAAQAAKADFPRNFTERKPFIRNSIRATKADAKTKTAVVGTVNRLLGIHLEGGEKKGDVAALGIRGTSGTGAAKPKQRHDAIERQTGARAIFRIKFQSGKEAYAQKTGSPQPRKRVRNGYTGAVRPRYPISILWILRRDQKNKIKADWRLEEAILDYLENSADDALQRVIDSAIAHAVKSGKYIP